MFWIAKLEFYQRAFSYIVPIPTGAAHTTNGRKAIVYITTMYISDWEKSCDLMKVREVSIFDILVGVL